MGFNCDYRGLINQKQGCWWIYLLVNSHITMEHGHRNSGFAQLEHGDFP